MSHDLSRLAGNAYKFVSVRGRELDAARISFLFENGPLASVVDALAKYRNDDGGYGNGIEPDFLLPYSSPIATSVAFQIFREVGLPKSHELVTRAIAYLWNEYDETIPGWISVPQTVNEYPHAPWWHWSGDFLSGNFWGNPIAELAGHIVTYTRWRENERATGLVQFARDYLLNHDDEMEPHELYCFLRLADALPGDESKPLIEKLKTLIKNAICLDPEEWTSYKPQPVDFVWSKNSPFYPEYQKDIDRNIEFILSTVSTEGVWYPTWSWGDSYPRDWETARISWAGVLAVKHLHLIKEFG